MAKTNGIGEIAESIGKNVIDQLKALLGSEWGSLSVEDRQLLADVANDAGRIALLKLQGKDTKRDELQIQAQLANLADVVRERVRRSFWKAVDIVLAGAVTFAKVLI